MKIGFGAWAIGGGMWGGPRDRDSRAALKRAYELGVRLIDTAAVYGSGHSERLVGEFVKSHPDVMVATKVPPKSGRWPARPGSLPAENFPADWIVRSCERSLDNLGRSHIDLLQLHVWADSFLDSDDWYEAMVKLRQAGKIRRIGVSINSHDPASALRLVQSGRVDALQVFYNIFDQSPEDELFPACLEHKVDVLARVPFDEGSLTGKLREDTRFPEGDFRSQYFGGDLLKETVRRVEALRPILQGAAASMARGALRYCISHSAVTWVIPGVRNAAQAEEDCAAAQDGPLPDAVLKQLRAHRWVRSPY